MLAAPVGWTPRSHSFSRGEVLLSQHQLRGDPCCPDQPGPVCGLEGICAQVSPSPGFGDVVSHIMQCNESPL